MTERLSFNRRPLLVRLAFGAAEWVLINAAPIAGAFAIAALIGLPFAIYFYNLTP
jgi:hypothetical protein